ncbi:hypothetical protein M2322_002670 [Rhodoblastus acidophilus]|uniref:hypothetical protein n=1 Tax=Rhodoblastus acidophilus TaxID=1074 RepID=UPI0022245687|nr:hypothetical protein [Rhodoblastus acidophilus]MCW2317116.1 hypothetical protein [Rhodoblastus acidophilus]
MQKPTILELRDAWREDSDAFELVHEETGTDDHGYSYTYVFERILDGTYWSTSGVCQGGGEYHELREGIGDVTRVWPIIVTRTEFTTKEPTA